MIGEIGDSGRKLLSRLGLAGIAVVALSALALAQSGADKADLGRQLIRLSNGTGAMEQLIPLYVKQIATLMRQMNPSQGNMAATIVEEFAPAEMKNQLSDLEAGLGRIYANNFSEAELRELIAFYRTPVGAKLAATLPKLTQESSEVGRVWGEQVGRVVMEKAAAKLKQP